MKSEATHYTMFLEFARKYGRGVLDVEKLWEEFLAFEAEVIAGYGNKELIHG
jgi:tRNA-(ms[2]io[6]A)-hydroxylase